jgi:hypothetical protein
MELLGQLLVGVGLDAQGLAYREHLEEKGKSSSIALSDVRGHQSLVILDEIEKSPLSLHVLRRKRGVSAHPQL